MLKIKFSRPLSIFALYILVWPAALPAANSAQTPSASAQTAAPATVSPPTPARAAIDARLNQLESEVIDKIPSQSALEQLQGLVAQDPKYFRSRLMMGTALDKIGLPNDAIEQYKLAVEYGPNSPKAVVELVKALINVGQADSALRMLNAAHSRFPDDPEITSCVGIYYLSKGNLKVAEQNFDLAAARNPNVDGLQTGLAQIRISQRRYKEALELAETELKRHPKYAIGNAVKGIALMNLQRYDEAREPLHLAFLSLGLKPGYAKRYLQSLVHSRHFAVALEPAMVAYAVGMEQYSDDQEVREILFGLIRLLPPDQVRQELPKLSDLVDVSRKNGTMHYNLGLMLEKAGYRDLSTREFAKAVKLDPNNFDATLKLATNLELYYQKYDEALMYLTKAHALRPADDSVSDRLIRLQNRLPGRSGDLAWQLKDLIRKQKSPVD